MTLTADAPSRRRLSKPTHRRALELLAGCGHEGCTEAVLLAHGFTVAQLVELVRAGMAIATAHKVGAGREQLEVATLRITDAGRRAVPYRSSLLARVVNAMNRAMDHLPSG